MELKNKCIAITGATGFYGGHLTEMLLARGARVRAVVRNPDKSPWMKDLKNVTFVKADLRDRAALAKGFEGVDAVIGNAAIPTMLRKSVTWDDYVDVNIVGTENVLNAMADVGVRRLIHISTVGVYNVHATQLWLKHPIKETHGLLTRPYLPLAGAFRVSKAMAEVSALELAARHGLDMTIIRTCGTYGKRDPNLLPWLKRAQNWSVAPAPILRFPTMYVEDAIGAIVESLVRDYTVGRVYNVTGDPHQSVYEFLKAWKRVIGGGPKLVPIPVPLWVVFDSSTAEKELNFHNRSSEEGLRLTLF